ncbi:hypothetical protein [Gordonia sputi]|uniref:hypothetical protein n=1 Tax=Gordonia sputi TaxID=36823 RepID=UPI00226EA30B|nr:hypothetical protein [Gordonia sputi]
MLGYVLLLIASASIGAFITLLASNGGGWTVAFGIIMVVSLILACICFRVEVDESLDNEPGDETVINAQLLIPPEDRADMAEYEMEHEHKP